MMLQHTVQQQGPLCSSTAASALPRHPPGYRRPRRARAPPLAAGAAGSGSTGPSGPGSRGSPSPPEMPPAIQQPPIAPPQPQPHKGALRVLHTCNELTKWVVSAVALYILCTSSGSLRVAWALLGAVANAALCKILKRVINQQRPPNARSTDPGMPSAHAQSLGYLGLYPGLCLVLGDPLPGLRGAAAAVAGPAWSVAAVAALAAAGLMAWLRVVSGYHTAPQVVVGWFVGTAMARAWHWAGTACVLPAVHAGHPSLAGALLWTTWAAVAAFACASLAKLLRSMRAPPKLQAS